MLKALREEKGWKQDDLAAKLGVGDRSTVSTWESGTRWPQGDTLQRLIAITVGSDMLADANVSAVEITTLIDELQKSGKDSTQIADGMMSYAYPKVLASLILKAQGAGADSRCIQLFFDHRDKVREEIRRNGSGEVRNVTPQQSAWNAGQGVLASPSPPSRQASPQDVVVASIERVEPDDVYSQVVSNKEREQGSGAT